jgi:hypothetical protein
MQIPSDMVLQEAIAALPAEILGRLIKDVQAESEAAGLAEAAPLEGIAGSSARISAAIAFGIVVGMKAAEVLRAAEPK